MRALVPWRLYRSWLWPEGFGSIFQVRTGVLSEVPKPLQVPRQEVAELPLEPHLTLGPLRSCLSPDYTTPEESTEEFQRHRLLL